MILLSIGDRVRTGRYQVHSRFQRVANFIQGSDMVFLADESVGGGPLTVLARDADFETIDRLEIGDDQVVADRETMSLQGVARYVSRGDSDQPPVRLSRAKLHELKTLLIAEARSESMVFLLKDNREKDNASDFERAMKVRLADGARLLQNALLYNHPMCLARAIHTLKGCGRGLTPSGDDYLAGCLTALHWTATMKPRKKEKIINRISHLSETDNPLANAFLRMASQYRLFEPMRVFIESLSPGATTDLAAGVRRLLAHGETSGADWATGFVMTLEGLAREGHR